MKNLSAYKINVLAEYVQALEKAILLRSDSQPNLINFHLDRSSIRLAEHLDGLHDFPILDIFMALREGHHPNYADPRINIEEAPYQIRDQVSGIAAIIPRDKLADTSPDYYTVDSSVIEWSERSIQVPIKQEGPAIMTGFLISDMRVATAGHLPDINLENNLVVFDFIRKKNNPLVKINRDSVFEIESFERHPQADCGLITLKSKPQNRQLFSLDARDVHLGEAQALLGCGQGYPAMFTPAAPVCEINDLYYSVSFQAYNHHSGSPVLDVKDGRVKGLLIGSQFGAYYLGNGISIAKHLNKSAICPSRYLLEMIR